MIMTSRPARRLRSVLLGIVAVATVSGVAGGQEVNTPPQADTSVLKANVNTTAGEFTPAKGFQVFTSPMGSLSISFYGLFRYLNQTGDSTFTDHLGREQKIKLRNDLNWHRSMVWFNGHFWRPNLRYNLTVWALGSTQQTLVFGNLQYKFNEAVSMGVGMAPNLTNRSMQGSFPFWAGSDRQMTEEAMRGGFSSGAWISGQPVKRLWYNASLNTNLSQLGVTASNDPRSLAYSGSLQWLPTTGEFGPRGGFGDLEHHEKVATRFGTSMAHVREGRAAPDDQPNNETQLRLSDGLYAFQAGALGDGVTIRNLDYDILSFDAGLKYKGFTFQGEYYMRSLSNFETTAPTSVKSIYDKGIQLQAMQMVVPKLLGVYATYGVLQDQFKRNPYEISGGASFYPTGTRSWRLNLHVIRVEKSPAGSNFGYYVAGQSGMTYSLGTDIIF